MKKRQYLNQTQPSQNLDSFLDILTNTVGVLIFISLFVYLVAAKATNIIRTPMLTASNKTSHFFEVRDGQIFYVEDPELDRSLERLFASLPDCYVPDIPQRFPNYLYDYYWRLAREYQACENERRATIENFQVTTKYYNVGFTNESLVYKPLEAVEGETPAQLTQSDSDFQQTLSTLDPETEYLAFLVESDSYEAFRTARQVAWDLGFDVGWEPRTVDQPLVFGSGGRSVDVQ